MNIDLERLPPPARNLVTGKAPPPARLMAAGGVAPGLKPGEVITVVAALTEDSDAKVAGKARETLAKLPPPLLQGALQAQLEAPVIHLLSEHYLRDAGVISALLRMPALGGDTLLMLAERADEAVGEVVATNEVRLLQHPEVIEKLYLNKHVRMSTADRLLELAVRSGIELKIPAFKEAAAAIQNELIPEASPEPTFDDVLFQETERIASSIVIDTEHEDTHVINDEGEEVVKAKVLPLHAQLDQMTVSQKIRRAMLGSSGERLLLVRDTNRLVAAAAAQSPLLNEGDAARIAASRQVSDDVLRIIARNRDFTRNYTVKLNLVMNPRTPYTFTARLMPLLRDNDLRSIAKSKHVPAQVNKTARQLVLAKQGKKQ